MWKGADEPRSANQLHHAQGHDRKYEPGLRIQLHRHRECFPLKKASAKRSERGSKTRQAVLENPFDTVTLSFRPLGLIFAPLPESAQKRTIGLCQPDLLFSGLLKCGCCDGQYGIITKDRYGCLNRNRRGTCDNGRTIRRDVIEERVLAGLTEKLVSAENVAEAVRAHAEELNQQNRERRAQTDIDRKALD
jgi:hypothetical protein